MLGGLPKQEKRSISPQDTAIGSLMHYISSPERKQFQPMNISFGLMPSYFEHFAEPQAAHKKKTSKDQRRLETTERSLASLGQFLEAQGISCCHRTASE